MALARRLFLGGFTAGAVTVVASGTQAEAAGETTVFPGPVKAEKFVTDATAEAAYFKATTVSDHAVTVFQAATSGGGAALNVSSHNPGNSAMYLAGTETDRGTLKISHLGYADGSDKNAAALSIDLRTTVGSPETGLTAAQGIYMFATQGPTRGNLIALRNNPGLDDFVVKGTGRIGIGIDRAATPAAQLHVVQRATDGAPALLVEGAARVAGPLRIEGATRITNTATVPTSVDSGGGGALYAENGALKWRGSGGTVTTLAPA